MLRDPLYIAGSEARQLDVMDSRWEMLLMRTEFHVHTKYSHDSVLGQWGLLIACKIRKVDCIAITDHNEIEGALSFRSFLGKHGIDVIVGEEIFTSEGEIIGLFLSDKIEPGLSPENTIKEIRRQNGIVYVPHPYDEKRCGTVLSTSAQFRLAKEFDCMEVHNGRNVKREFSAKQEEIARALNQMAVVGGDSHCGFEVGRNCCLTGDPFSRESFCEVLNEAIFVTSGCHPFSHLATRMVRAMKMIAKGDISGVCRILSRKLVS